MAKKQNKYVWGICTNRDADGEGNPCPKCNAKLPEKDYKQRVLYGHDFVCSECGERLTKTKPPKQTPVGLFVGIGAVCVLAAVIAIVCMTTGVCRGSKNGADTLAVDTARADTPVKPFTEEPDIDTVYVNTVDTVRDTVIVVETPKATVPSKNPSWGQYEGPRNGKGLAHGNGVLRITRATTINGETAQPGERIEGVFRNGYVNSGSWFKKDGNVVRVKDIKVY